jgi:methionine synthase I (cobalamin-dependent)
MTWLRALSSGQVLLMDAAMGTQLGTAVSVGSWTVLHDSYANRVREIHAEAVAAGAEVILTCSFQNNPIALAARGLEDRLEELNARAIDLARQAAPGKVILGDVGPILSAGRYEEFADTEALERTLVSLAEADAILFETCSSPAVLSAALYAQHRIEEVADLPLLVSLTYYRDRSGELVTFSGHRPETYARNAVRHGVAALGVNCGKEMGGPELVEILRRYRNETDLPLFVRPNAGTPDALGRHPRDAEALGAMVAELVAAGARMIGGCCGTTAEYLRRMKGALQESNQVASPPH